MDVWFFFVCSLGVFWAVSVGLDRLFDEKQCVHCKQWANARHMIEFVPDKLGAEAEHWHTSCFLFRYDSKSPHSDNK